MPQKKIKKTPFVLLAMFVLAVLVSVVSLWSVISSNARCLTDAADISLSQIDYITLRYQKENGTSQVKKITDENEIKELYSLLSDTKVSKRVSLGTNAYYERNNISVKLKGGETVCIGSSNRFEKYNSGPLSAFFVCYYDVVKPEEFKQTVSHYAA